MTKRDIKKLAQASYIDEELDEKTVFTISEKLNRKNIKEYINALKRIEKQKEVIIALPDIKSYNKNDKFFATLFEKKNITYQEDQSLILGVKITDNDMIYDMTLKSILDENIKRIEQTY